MSQEFFQVQEYTVPSQHIREYPGATAHEQEEVLSVKIKHYKPLDNLNPQPGDVTIIGGHANGFPKELYEPLWDEILHRSKNAGFRIRGIWAADVAWQGRSGIANEHKLGNDPGWFDHSRDLLHIINTYRAEMPRPIVGVGHSMGGCQIAHLAIIHPRLFTTLILIDPVIQTFASAPRGAQPARLSTFRRDKWPSRAAAAKSVHTSPFYKAWDPRVAQLWIEYGFRDLPSALYPDAAAFKENPEPEVTLTTTRHQEVFTFLRPNYAGYDGTAAYPINRATHADIQTAAPTLKPFYRFEPAHMFFDLPHLRPSVMYILGADSAMSPPDFNEVKLTKTGVGDGGSGGAKEGRVEMIVLKGVGHLVPMEAVQKCADGASEWLGRELARWSKAEEEFRREWAKKTDREKAMVDEEWKKQIGGDPRADIKKSAKVATPKL